MQNWGWSLIVVVISLTLISCAGQPAGDAGQIEGGLLVWHNWPQPEAVAIEDLLHRFQELHPGVVIVSEYVPDEVFVERFSEQVKLGLGPDVIIGVEPVIPDLIHTGYLRDLSEFDLNTAQLAPAGLEALRYDEGQYGVPFSGHTTVLYYNKSLIDAPATRLNDLIDAAETGHTVALPTDFYHGYWGVRAFGGEILTAEGEVLDDDGFGAWLAWLKEAQKEPNIILNNDYEDLVALFAAGNAAYFVGASHELPRLQDSLGREVVGVAAVPGADNPQPGGFLELEVMAITTVSADVVLGLKLIEFFTNATHQRALARYEFGELPLNQAVQFDQRLFPVEATLNAQKARGVIVPLAYEETKARLSKAGDLIYLEVLEGVLSPVDAATRLRDEMLRPATAASGTGMRP